MNKNLVVQPRRLRWLGVTTLVLLFAVVVFVVWIDPWIYERKNRRRVQPVLMEVRREIIAQEQCLIRRHLPVQDPHSAISEAFFTGALDSTREPQFDQRMDRLTRDLKSASQSRIDPNGRYWMNLSDSGIAAIRTSDRVENLCEKLVETSASETSELPLARGHSAT